ncbi:Eco57I restriction-modification methylase domain-containing protein [Nocardia macrotermitis]|uniref:site-specific DNA-methyltransferase (adenine-specific) n=1 Tax=Nocardia macrotermitis TaxID=2585198 RepID=A0A7K0D6F2_9NOCA|nr:methyltransferase domain-containing protein [Nocardia macrotermitis]MQY20414.1 Release factor glutamine methyltransferase [Nocardia macrotermitis]
MDGRGGRVGADRRARASAGAGVRKRHGRHYTPVRLAEFLAERLLEHVVPQGGLRILDPACGDGELLLAVYRAAVRRFPGIPVQLTGFDLDVAAVALARERAAGLPVSWQVGDFLCAAEELADGSFDAVITNPPYVRTQQLGGATARLLSVRFGLRGRIDLTHPFVASVPRLLRPGGVLGLLCANRFLTTKAGANLRALLRAELTPVELYDLGDTKLFEAAVLPAVTVAVRGPIATPCRYVSAYEIPDDESASAIDLFTALATARECTLRHDGRHIAIEAGILDPGSAAQQQESSRVIGPVGPVALPDPAAAETEAEHRQEIAVAGQGDADIGVPLDDSLYATHTAVDDSTPWRMSRPGVDEWLRRVRGGTWRTFGEVARIRVGIKTTADRVFISDEWERHTSPPEPELLFDLITHHDVVPWRISRERPRQVLYPYDVSCSRRIPVDLTEFPCAASYLAEHKDVLAARDYLTASGREWFEIWVPQRPHLWRHPKLVFPDISVAPRFALDRSGAIVNGDCYWISVPDIGSDTLAYLLMGVANSTLGLRFYDAVCGNRLYAARRRWITQYVARLPVPDPSTPAAVALVHGVRAALEHDSVPDPRALDEWVEAAFGLDQR